MAITQEEILQLTVSMFNASLGANYLADIESANFATTTELAAYYGTLTQFTSQFDGMTDAEQVTAMLSNFGLDSTNTAAFDYFTAQVAAGVSNAVTLQAADAYLATQTAEVLATYNLTDAAATLVNKTAAATYYSVTTAQSAATVDDLQATVSTITEDVATVATANAAVDTTVAAAVVTAAINTAAAAAYTLQITTETPGSAAYIALQLAVATTAEAAILDGAVQGDIDDALAILVEDNAAVITLANIVALDNANTAVTDYLTAVDTTVVTAAADAATVAEIDTAVAAAITAYADAESATDLTQTGDLVTENIAFQTAAEIADINTANISVLNAALTVATATEAAAQAEVDAIDDLEEAIDAATIAATAYETAYAADVATSNTVAAAEAAYNVVGGRTAVLNTDGTVSEVAVAAITGTDGVTSGAAATVTITSTNGLLVGQTVTVGDTTITATEAMTATEVADAISAAYTITGFTVDTTSNATAVYTQDTAADYTFATAYTDVAIIGGTDALTAAVVAAQAADVAAQETLSDADTALTAAVQLVVDTEVGSASTMGTAIIDTTAGVVTLDYTDTTAGVAAPLAADLITKAALTVAASENITALNEAKADLDAMMVIANTLLPLLKTQTTEEGDLVGNVVLANADALTGTTSTQDVYFVNALVAGDTVTLSTDAVESAVDYMYVGSDYTVNTDLTAGDNAVMEMFITEGTTDADTLLTFETAAFGSESAGDFYTVELTGVATTDVTVSTDGLITFA